MINSRLVLVNQAVITTKVSYSLVLSHLRKPEAVSASAEGVGNTAVGHSGEGMLRKV